ncbi:hypothetical protein TNIN_496101 [Trichonephila inaurata madagascariensis]|uniref:Secreted protein n=1 Tax=Trichonephila inaurata madagascariensis TaxID=2747483 RepID=A0A8X7C1R2_9ARAC|nr:hypothetical protein TNIN_496101 [Trichonephila inaurata madagascariensis]
MFRAVVMILGVVVGCAIARRSAGCRPGKITCRVETGNVRGVLKLSQSVIEAIHVVRFSSHTQEDKASREMVAVEKCAASSSWPMQQLKENPPAGDCHSLEFGNTP